MKFTFLETPVGSLFLAGETVLESIVFPTSEKRVDPPGEWREDPDFFRKAICQLRAYFSGELKTFSLDLHLTGTPFQKRVWEALARVPYGQTISYGALAVQAGSPGAARAVGAAMAANPVPIVIPCHRVIGSNGKLTGFGGGLNLKQSLLDLEQRGA